MTPEKVWRGKSDEELVAASHRLSDYTDVGQRVIMAELQRRRELGQISEAPVRGESRPTADSHESSIRTVGATSWYVHRLWRGCVPLAITYWLWGVLGSWVWLILITLTNLASGPGLGLVVALFGLVYSIYISVAIWRSAVRYEGRRVWSELARISIAVGIARAVVGILFG